MKTISKKQKTFPLVFLLSFYLNSCIFFQSQPSLVIEEEKTQSCSMGNARFIADQISTPNNHNPITLNYKEGLIDSFTVNLKTCLKDSLRPDVSIQNSSFEIIYDSNLTGKEEKVEAISDTDGCIQWQEIYKYKYTLKSTWIGLTRVIRQPEGGAFSGGVLIETAANPWISPDEQDSGLPQILDMRCEYINNSIFSGTRSQSTEYQRDGLKFLETADQNKPLLWAPNFSLQVEEVSENQRTTEQDNKLTETEIKELLLQYGKACEQNSGEAQSSADCYKRYFKFDFRIPLEFRSIDSIGSFDTQLKGGVYDIESFLLIQPKGDETTYKLSSCNKENISFNENDKSLSFSCIFEIAFFNQNSVFKVLHRISTVNPNDPNNAHYLPMREFQGNYTIEFRFGSVLTNVIIDANDENIYSVVLIDPNENLNLISSIGDEVIDAKNEGLAESVNLKVLQLGATGDFKYSNIQSGENTIEREISFVGKICLTDALNSQKLENTKFRVFLQRPRKQACEEDEELNQILKGQIEEVFSDPQTQERFETDNEKCLTLPITVPHRVFNKQRYFEVIAHLLSEDLNLYGSVKLALNPWQRAFQAFQDAQNLDEKNIRFEVGNIDPPELVINQFRSINLFPSYGLDKLLNIHIFHRFYLLFQPFIRRPDNVSLGLNHQSRELLRDGYYLVRVLILRNPKETEDWETVQNQDNLDQTRATIQVDQEIDLSTTEYITHTDSVARAKANFVNFYMPIYLSTKQMYYIASRNMIVIQIYPADPSSIVYKEDGTLDDQKTRWQAFVDHDLVNRPYGGPVNLQNWVNWNLLQPININTDEVIELSDIGRKYKLFDFSSLGKGKSLEELDREICQRNEAEDQAESDPENESSLTDTEFQEQALSEGCEQALQALQPFSLDLENLYQLEKRKEELSIELANQTSHEETSRIEEDLQNTEQELRAIRSNLLEQTETTQKESVASIQESCQEDSIQSSPALEIYKREVESKYTPELLNNFSLENALKPIVLESEEGEKLIEDLQNSYEKYQTWKEKQKETININLFNPTLIRESFTFDPDSYPLLQYHKRQFSQYFHNSIPMAHFGPTYIPQQFDFIKGRGSNHYPVSLLVQSYLLMLENYVTKADASLALFDFINENKLVFNLDLEEVCQENPCSLEEGLEKLIESEFLKDLSFSNDNSHEDFIKKQTLAFMILFLFPQTKLPEFLESSSNPYSSLKRGWLSDNESSQNYFSQIQAFLIKEEEALKKRFDLTSNPLSISLKASQQLDRLFQENSSSRLISDRIDTEDLNQEALNTLINEGIKTENINDFKSIGFFKSLCVFWFEEFMKSYLDKKTKIATYTNYIRQFDYLQILDHAYIKNKNDPTSFYTDLQSVIDGVEEGTMGEEEKACHQKYRQCVLEDFCFASPINQLSNNDSRADYCQAISPERKSCSSFVSQICADNNNKNLSLCRSDFVSETCYEDVNYFCRMHPDKTFCSDFENRCFKEYTGCLESGSLFEKPLDHILNDPNPAIETCVKDFNEFFKVENKMIVYDISHQDSDLKYKGGFLRNFGLSFNNSIGSYMNWTAQRGQSMSVSFDPTKIIPSLFTLGLSGSMSQNQSDNESNSGRIAWDGRAGEAIVLAVGKAEVEISVKEFQKCLIIKPRPNSFVASFQTGEPKDYQGVWSEGAKDLDKIVFSRPGLILCNPKERQDHEELEKIRESYYYISQTNIDPSNSQFLDLYDLANRPFIAILRGKREFLKFYHLARRINGSEDPINEQPNNQFIEHTDVAEYTRGLNLKLREVTQTGFYPGIYDYPWNVNEEIDASYLSNHNTNSAVNTLHPYKIFEVPSTSKSTIPIQR